MNVRFLLSSGVLILSLLILFTGNNLSLAQNVSPDLVEAEADTLEADDATSAVPVVEVEEDTEDSAKFTKVMDSHPNFVIISAIKSVAGEEPNTEFLDINVKTNLSYHFYSFFSVDVAFTNVQSEDTTKVNQTLTEAGFSFNYVVYTSKDSCRQAGLGMEMKIFDGIPYAGFHIGSIESYKSSSIYSTFSYIGFLWRMSELNEEEYVQGNRKVQPSAHNIYAEFALHSQKIPFLEHLRIKAGILAPLNISELKFYGIRSRVVLEVPIGGIYNF